MSAREEDPQRTTGDIVLAAGCSILQIMSAGAFANSFHERIRHLPAGLNGAAPSDATANIAITLKVAWFMFIVVSLAAAVYEIALIVTKVKYFRSKAWRGAFYCWKGVAALGCSGTVGIAIGSLEVIGGLALFLSALAEDKDETRRSGMRSASAN